MTLERAYAALSTRAQNHLARNSLRRRPTYTGGPDGRTTFTKAAESYGRSTHRRLTARLGPQLADRMLAEYLLRRWAVDLSIVLTAVLGVISGIVFVHSAITTPEGTRNPGLVWIVPVLIFEGLTIWKLLTRGEKIPDVWHPNRRHALDDAQVQRYRDKHLSQAPAHTADADDIAEAGRQLHRTASEIETAQVLAADGLGEHVTTIKDLYTTAAILART